MKRSITVLLMAGGFAVASILAVPVAWAADVFTLTSPAVQDNGTLAIKNACNDKQRSPNCVGENISPPLAWSNAPDGTKSFASCCSIPKVAPRRVCRTWWSMVSLPT
jgi:phosphatidylethanolamine-binding protein (PEBP) family uncharacterized protein